MQFAILGSSQADSERPGAALGEGSHEFVEFDVEAEAAACARRYDPMQDVVARDMLVVNNERERGAATERNNPVRECAVRVARQAERVARTSSPIPTRRSSRESAR